MFVYFLCTVSLVFVRVFPRFVCQRVESVVSEVRGREEKSSEDCFEEARQVTHSPLSMLILIYKCFTVCK